ncbi:hypothetical protein P152DRAFT_479755 [Eremomyces bilateralis CBS 781.70]|uniref:Prion-inhibition and propagation HeLo domain-containing protein n=1 Tax=Eremomyces bilateralis CBS 781.70 TaxID=1392243 RepID=A0A6G1GD04_9PEZI|nr:uncharacterized protein P152DRAFT_479755 [Eremomyces bilateralis CBS 781.70]KAF1815903.1 hypothetical protein P152DRAFT_479755 [Eremomyces bilateralis CBS 781.70]
MPFDHSTVLRRLNLMMADAADVVHGVVTFWKTCVQIFEVIDSGRNDGMEYELLRVKLEVERIRLVSWGVTIGLDNDGDVLQPDSRLERKDAKDTVMRLLACIQHVFEDSERLQSTFGLRPSMKKAEDSLAVEQAQFLLRAIFKKPYESLQSSARDPQRGASIKKQTRWAIHNKRNFQTMITEIQGHIDSLENLFPDSTARVVEAMRVEVKSSTSVEELRLLQDATAEEYRELADCASARLRMLGAASTTGTGLQTGHRTTSQTLIADGEDRESRQDVDDGDDGRTTQGEDPALTELAMKLNEIDLYCGKKRAGALSLQVLGANSYTSKVTTHCYWGGKKEDRWWDRDITYPPTTHASFALYKKKRFQPLKSQIDGLRDYQYDDTEESQVLFNIESYPKYESIHPGTVTVEGFGLEAWEFEEEHHPLKKTILVNRSNMPPIKAKTLLRRIDELQNRPPQFGWNPKRDAVDLKDFTGDMGIKYINPAYAVDDWTQFSNLFQLLNRTDIFANFLMTSSIGSQWHTPGDGHKLWNLLWQVIIAKELARRFEHGQRTSYSTGFTPRILASMIVADLWLNHISIILVHPELDLSEVKAVETAELKAKAEAFKKKGNEAFARKEFDDAIENYTEAIKIDPGNAIYRSNRSAAQLSMERHEKALEDAAIAMQLDPKYVNARSRFGHAAAKLGLLKAAIGAYEAGMRLAGTNATDAMRKGLAEAKAKEKASLEAIDKADEDQREVLRKAYLDRDFEIILKSVKVYSRVHEQQVEGILRFAAKMKWPYMNEVRDYAEDVYGAMLGGQNIPLDLYDWLYGMTLPGKWCAFKIMSAMILCTPSIKESVGVALLFDCGLSLPKKSYWRIRTVLGRVLGCLPGVISLCGWTGPCPPVEIIPPLPENQPCHVHLKARQLSLLPHKTWHDGDPIDIAPSVHPYKDIELREGEEPGPWAAEMRDARNWIIPEPPVRQVSTCELKAIQLKKDLSASEPNSDSQAAYRAQIVLKMDDSDELTTYRLYTNPVFITVPACHGGPKGAHEVHRRELYRYENIWTVERLKDHTEEDSEERNVMVINATGNGAELLARAWCSERGKNAVIRRTGGPCFVCAERAASSSGLGVGVLIWVS